MSEPYDIAANMKFLDDLITLQAHPAFKAFMAMMEAEEQASVARLTVEDDPHKILKVSGVITAIRRIKSWPQIQVEATRQDIEAEKERINRERRVDALNRVR